MSFVGDKEFEDAFEDRLIADALDAYFPRQDGLPWIGQIPTVKARARGSGKFSAELQLTVRAACILRQRSEATKPNIAAAIARQCKVADDVPAAILRAILDIRTRAGIALEAPAPVGEDAPTT